MMIAAACCRILPWMVVAWTLLSPSLGQQVWHVNCHGGPGVDFTDLPQAVAAAAPGDTILVYYQGSGCSPHYTAPTITKPLRIEGFNVMTIPTSPALPATPSSIFANGVLIIRDIPAGEQVVISNIQLAILPVHPVQPAGFAIADCEGQVVLERLEYWTGGLAGSALSIDNCRDVVLRDCEIYLGGVPLSINNSEVLITKVALHHDDPWPPLPAPWNFPPYTQSIPALDLWGSEVTIVGSALRGHELIPNSGNPQPAVRLNFSRLNVGPATQMRGSGSFASPWLAYYTPAPAFVSVHIDPRAYVAAINPSVPPAPITTWIDATIHSSIVAGYPFYVDVGGPPGGFALLLIGNLTPARIPTPIGDLAMDPATAQPLALVYLPQPDGWYSWTLTCAATAPVAVPFVFQSLTLTPSGAFGLTLPSPLTVGWPHGQIP